MEAVERICVFRALPLGELVCATPALRALRQRFAQARITLVGLAGAADFAARVAPWVDEFVEFPGWPGLPARAVDWERLPRFLHELEQRRFDLALQLHDSGRLSNPIVRAFGARRSVGYHPADVTPRPAAGHLAWPYPEHLHEVHRNLQLVARLGARDDDDRVVFPLRAGDEEALRRLRPDLAALAPRRYVCLHAGASDAPRSWAPRQFARVGDALAADGWTVVLTGGAGERVQAAAVAAQMATPALSAACEMPLGAFAVLLSRARLLVSADGGVAQLAAGLALPSVVVFSDRDPRRWAALDAARHVALRDDRGVTAPAVIAAARRLLADESCAVAA